MRSLEISGRLESEVFESEKSNDSMDDKADCEGEFLVEESRDDSGKEVGDGEGDGSNLGGVGGNMVWVMPKSFEGSYVLKEVDEMVRLGTMVKPVLTAQITSDALMILADTDTIPKIASKERGSSKWLAGVTAEGTYGLEMKFFCWSVCFSKGGSWAWYSVDVDGENIIRDCILGVGLTWVLENQAQVDLYDELALIPTRASKYVVLLYQSNDNRVILWTSSPHAGF
ncbi:hypothetical protein WN943_015044 [Citrus x changshan-huyou]